ncbi:MAG: undecaprenyl-diphosphate phosphatase [Candidatus Cloacimonetes bacterium]|nr:undecaprenyl-diphosphate phosphatase [Candidatus Cloacimonadota bacterium]
MGTIYGLLGFVQGLTEFLPISSSSHLSILEAWLLPDVKEEVRLAINACLHAGTALALLVYFRLRILNWILAVLKFFRNPVGKNPALTELSYVFLASIPTALIGLWLKLNHIANIPFALQGVCLIITGYLLTVSRKWHGGSKELGLSTVLVLGMAQGLCVIPGLSRSGILFCLALFLGIKRGEALMFTFLVSLPAVLGAILLSVPDLWLAWGQAGFEPVLLLMAVMVSFVVGTVCLRYLNWLYSEKVVGMTGIYCQFAGYVLISGYFISWFRGNF